MALARGAVLRVHFDEMIDGENRERHPHRRRRRGADFEHGEADDGEREHDLEIDSVVGRELDLRGRAF